MSFKGWTTLTKTADRNGFVRVGRESNTVSLFPSQQKVFRALKDAENLLAICPTGWGKSTLLKFLLANKLRESPDKKAIIAVPQNVIAPNFLAPSRLSFGAETVAWDVNWQYVDVSSKLDRLSQFLKSTSNNVGSRVLVITHSCLCAAMKRGVEFDNVIIVIDECHHIRADGETNVIGSAVNSLVQNNLLWLTTATYGRGDNIAILSPELEDSFTRVDVPFEDYWSSLRHLKTFEVKYVVYDNSLTDSLSDLLDTAEPTLIYCPRVGSRFLLGKPKAEFIAEVIDLLVDKYDAYLWQPGDTAPNAIIDLTDTNLDRSRHLEFLNENQDKVIAILAVGMMKEGMDWTRLRKLIDLAPSTVPIDRLQRFGRGTRDYPGKDRFEYYMVLPAVDNDESLCEENLGQLILSITDNMYYFPLTPWPSRSKWKDLDQEAKESLVCDSIDAVVSGGDLEEEVRRRVEASGLDADLAAEVLAQLTQIVEINTVDLGFRKLSHKRTTAFFRELCSGACGAETVKEMRELLSSKDEEIWMRYFEALRDSNSGAFLTP